MAGPGSPRKSDLGFLRTWKSEKIGLWTFFNAVYQDFSGLFLRLFVRTFPDFFSVKSKESSRTFFKKSRSAQELLCRTLTLRELVGILFEIYLRLAFMNEVEV